MAETKIGLPAVGYVSAVDKQVKRAIAVSAALELIALRVSSSPLNDVVERELGKLSSFADTIQAALEAK